MNSVSRLVFNSRDMIFHIRVYTRIIDYGFCLAIIEKPCYSHSVVGLEPAKPSGVPDDERKN